MNAAKLNAETLLDSTKASFYSFFGRRQFKAEVTAVEWMDAIYFLSWSLLTSKSESNPNSTSQLSPNMIPMSYVQQSKIQDFGIGLSIIKSGVNTG